MNDKKTIEMGNAPTTAASATELTTLASLPDVVGSTITAAVPAASNASAMTPTQAFMAFFNMDAATARKELDSLSVEDRKEVLSLCLGAVGATSIPADVPPGTNNKEGQVALAIAVPVAG